MKISFDIDNTLIPYSDEFEVESSTSILNLFSKEGLRKGTTQLFRNLEDQKHEIWIYTTSFRSIFKLKMTFAKYGLYPKGFINQRVNQAKLRKHNSNVSKNPDLFKIDLHVDDSAGVKVEGDKLGFATIIVEPKDPNWTSTVLKEVKRKELNLDWQFKELLVTLIALKSNSEKQKEIYGFGDSTSEMIEYFFTYYDNQKINWLELEYLSDNETEKLDKIKTIIEHICKDEDNEYWVNQKESEDATIIKGLSHQVLQSLGKGTLEVEFEHENDYDDDGNLIIQRTNTKLKSGNEL